jgi:predicted nucleic acid-binding protein
MTIYLDTSALVKLHVTESGSADVYGWVEAGGILVTVRIAYAEARAALARHTGSACSRGRISAAR